MPLDAPVTIASLPCPAMVQSPSKPLPPQPGWRDRVPGRRSAEARRQPKRKMVEGGGEMRRIEPRIRRHLEAAAAKQRHDPFAGQEQDEVAGWALGGARAERDEAQ